MDKQAIIVGRGFMTYLSDDVVLKSNKVSVDEIINAARFSRTAAEKEDYHYNKAVQEIFNRYMAKNDFIRDLVFKEDIIKVAYRAFGSFNFVNWLTLQNESTCFTAMHKKFLIETLRYIETGARMVNVSTWTRLIEKRPASEVNRSVEYNASKLMEDTSSKFVGNLRVVDTSDFICKWVKWDDGFNDLLRSLYIVFGRID